jgi:2-polyprenyl-3-methyl-5-hydroxy-6-metoxy-1,4-benzoquinol methylase
MNKFGSIKQYRDAVDNNLLFKLKTVLKVRRDLRRVLNSIPKEGFEKVKKEYWDHDPYPGYSKYLNVKPWMLDNVWRAHLLGLDNTKAPKTILDIGTGNGYFPYLCKQYGHTVRTIDIDFDPIFNSLVKLLDIPRLDYAVKAYENIPPFDVKFDIVTGFHTYFNGHRTAHLWKWQEWEFFMKDLKNNLCNPDAEAFFIINTEHDTKMPYTPELKEYFLSKGAEIDNDRVYFKNLHSF